MTSEQVESRKEDGYVNELPRKQGKSVLQIFLGNIFTFFNMLYLVIAVILMVYAQWTQITFLIVAVVNTGIAIFQEIKSKKSLDKLRIVAAPAVKVVRDGKETEISVEEIVLDDVMKLETGVQICADARCSRRSDRSKRIDAYGRIRVCCQKKGRYFVCGQLCRFGRLSCKSGQNSRGKLYRRADKPRTEIQKAALAAARRSQNHTQGRCGDYHTDDLLYVADQLYDISGFGAEQ